MLSTAPPLLPASLPVATGTDGQWWLDWDREYGAWKAAGMRVHASFQFNSDVFPPSAWGSDPYTTAWNVSLGRVTAVREVVRAATAVRQACACGLQ